MFACPCVSMLQVPELMRVMARSTSSSPMAFRSWTFSPKSPMKYAPGIQAGIATCMAGRLKFSTVMSTWKFFRSSDRLVV